MLSLQSAVDTRPPVVQVRHSGKGKLPALVEIRDQSVGILLEGLSIKEAKAWLDDMGYRWVTGTNGIYMRHPNTAGVSRG